MDLKKIEKKWQKRWLAKRIFESNPDGKKFFINIPYPYVNGAPHIGAAFSYFRCDSYARFKRMLSFNVLYPQGFHATGEPILGAIERLKKNDKTQIDTFKIYGANDKDIKNFINKGPKFVAKFWMKKWIEDMKKAGLSIDWRRSFITTTMTPTYSRFVEWQYNTLKKKGYVTQGTHPVIWCPKCQSPTGDHDRLEGIGESVKDFMWVKFKLKNSDLILMAGTTRPDALYGQTNLWIDPEGEYFIVKVENEKWVVGSDALKKIEDQFKGYEIVGKTSPQELIGKWVKGPLVDYEIYILPAWFVDAKVGSGIVYSALETPVDYMEIRRYHEHPDLISKYNLDLDVVLKIVPRPNISVKGMGEDLGKAICEEFNAKSYRDSKQLEAAKDELNKRVFRKGIMRNNCGRYSGMTVQKAQDLLKKDLVISNEAVMFYELSGRVVCRCTTDCIIKVLENQWFLKYSDEKWKEKVRSHLKNMTIYPDKARINLENTIDWLNDKACTRRTGLGTPLPWDKSWIVETLSDSTIYMAYYTLSRIINEKKIPAKKLTDDVFNCIFLNKGVPKTVSKTSGLSEKIIKELKSEFDYFYPVDIRFSGKDLIQNHLTFFLFHHVALFPESKWPKGIAANGYVNVEKEKMSKSKGNIIPLRDLIDDLGTDLVRINLITSNEGLDDADWRIENVKSYKTRLEFLYEIIKDLKKAKSNKKRNIDLYLQSSIQKEIKESIENYELTKFRTASYHALFNNINTLRWYLNRVDGIKNANKKILKKSLEDIVRLIAPLAPHLSEELWSMLGHKTFVSTEKMPSPNNSLINKEAEQQEELIRQIISDVAEIEKIVKIKPKKAVIFIADDWKFSVYETVLKNKEKDVNEITKKIMSTGKYGKATIGFIQSLYKKISELKPLISRKNQSEILEEAKKFLEKEVGCKLEIEYAEKNKDPKARQANPQKPGILLE